MTDLVRLRTLIKAYPNCAKICCGDEEDSDLADIPVFLDGNLFTDFAKSIKEAYDQAFDTFDHHNTKTLDIRTDEK